MRLKSESISSTPPAPAVAWNYFVGVTREIEDGNRGDSRRPRLILKNYAIDVKRERFGILDRYSSNGRDTSGNIIYY